MGDQFDSSSSLLSSASYSYPPREVLKEVEEVVGSLWSKHLGSNAHSPHCIYGPYLLLLLLLSPLLFLLFLRGCLRGYVVVAREK